MDDYRGYVNLTEAARLIGVSVATLSRQRAVGIPLGGRDIGISPREVLRQADFFKRRPLTEVAGDLVQRAYRIGPDVATAVNAEADAYLSARPSLRPAAQSDFLTEARRVLPKRLFVQVAKYYRDSATPPAPLSPAGDVAPGRGPRITSAKAIDRDKLRVDAGARAAEIAPARTERVRRRFEPTVPASAEPRGLAQKA